MVYNVEQTIKKQVTITAGTTTKTSLPIPQGQEVGLKGYGYSWFTSNTYSLSTGANLTFPSRTDQEGSPSIPRIFDKPFPCQPGDNLSLEITNGDSADHTYDIVFYLVSSTMLTGPNYASTGGALTIETSSASGSGNSIAIYDSSFTTAAGVTARGLHVDPFVPTSIVQGSNAAITGTGAALGSGTIYDKVTIAADPNNTDNILLGNATAQVLPLGPGQSIGVKIASVATIFVKSSSGTQSASYFGS